MGAKDGDIQNNWLWGFFKLYQLAEYNLESV